jgi:hypothetical protein
MRDVGSDWPAALCDQRENSGSIGLNDAVADRDRNSVCAVHSPKLAAAIREMFFDRPLGDVENFTDVPRRLADSGPSQNLTLAFGEAMGDDRGW